MEGRIRRRSMDDDDDVESFYDAEDDNNDDSTNYSVLRHNSRYRYDRNLLVFADSGSELLPEFVGRGGGQGIFRVPPRAAVHPARPPCLDLRPHPLRETQAGSFLRTIVGTSSQLWAGMESGLRRWNFTTTRPSSSFCPVVGDEETAPFADSSRTSPTLCFAVDAGTRMVWSGHRDGRVRAWRMIMDQDDDDDFESGFGEDFSWQAHRGPVLALTFTSYGDIWSTSEGGIIKVWPWEAIQKAFSYAPEERHMATLMVERSFVDLRNQVTVGGVCPLPSADVKFLLSDHSRSKVWTATSQSFALWNSRTKELLKVISIDGQVETRVDTSPGQDSYAEDEIKTKFVSVSKKEKSQGTMNFFQRSRNALMGAADAVRRVAIKGAFGDDNRKTESMTISTDGTIWTGCTNGLLIQWDGNGGRLQELQYQSSSVQCLCSFGSRLWVGYLNGYIQVLDIEGNLLGGWVAHSSPVIDMTIGGGYIFTLANHGGIRGWNLTSPGPLDEVLRLELTNKEPKFTKFETIKILVGTWNVGQERASYDSLITWVGCTASEADIVVVGLQEVEMGAGFLAMAAAKETVGLEGSANGDWWLDTIGKTLDEGTTFEHVGSRQLAGLLISIWARKNLRKYIGDIDAGAVPCGFGRAIGNKGSVALKLRVYDKIFCFLNCHFAAHLEAVSRRNSDFVYVFREMSFSRPSASSSAAVQLLRGSFVTGSQSDGMPELSEADMVVFFGDLNYRLHGISYDEARDFVSQRSFDWLRERDQLRAEMLAGKVFQGMREALIRFPPTYKFEKNQVGLAGYDSGEKKRIPAWCDRILYRDSCSVSLEKCSLSCPVSTSVLQYDACMEVTDSDHKPVRCLFNVNIARVDEIARRQEYGEILLTNNTIRSLIEESSVVPETVVSTNNLILQNQDTTVLRITNRCNKDHAMFRIICEGQSSVSDDGLALDQHPRGAFGFPRWLEVVPAAGILKPGQMMEVSLHHEEFQIMEEFVDGMSNNWFCDNTRDEVINLVVDVYSSVSTQKRSHRIRVRRVSTSKTQTNKPQDNYTTAQQSNLLRRSEHQQLGSSTTDFEDMRYLQGL